jgi:outer membrane receptor protein involved in Fe transport
VLLASVALPRNFRFGARFRVVSGNPLETVLGAELVNSPYGWYYRPIRGDRGTTYQPVFHQLDLRIDKRWPLRRVAVTAYLDVQNVYDRRYPEVLVYTRDWAQQSSLIGLPIYPSIGVQIDY